MVVNRLTAANFLSFRENSRLPWELQVFFDRFEDGPSVALAPTTLGGF